MIFFRKPLFSHIVISLVLGLSMSCTACASVSAHNGFQSSAHAARQDTFATKTIYHVWKDFEFIQMKLTREPTILNEEGLMNKLIAINIVYPKEAREQLIGGTVIITAIVDEQGDLEDAYVSQGVGGGCSEEALHAVKLLRHTGFTPAEVDGQPVRVKFDIPITFQLPKD